MPCARSCRAVAPRVGRRERRTGFAALVEPARLPTRRRQGDLSAGVVCVGPAATASRCGPPRFTHPTCFTGAAQTTPLGQPQLGQNAGDVVLDRLLSEKQLLAD